MLVKRAQVAADHFLHPHRHVAIHDRQRRLELAVLDVAYALGVGGLAIGAQRAQAFAQGAHGVGDGTVVERHHARGDVRLSLIHI